MHIKRVDLTVGDIRNHLIRMTIPMTWGILALISFQLVNAFWVSRLGTEKLAAMSYTYPVTYAVFSIFLGFGIAMSSVVSRLLGAGQEEDVRRVTSHGLVIVFLTSILIAILGQSLMHPLFHSLGADDVMLQHIDDYMNLYWWGTFFICMPVVANSALRAGGETIRPAIVMTVAAVANALLDPVLIFGKFGFPRLELQGAALSNIIANFAAMSVSLTLMFKNKMVCLSYLKDWHLLKDSAKRLLVIALPVGLTNTLPSIYNSFVVSILTASGAAAVAAYGVVNRVESFAFVILIGLVSGMTPIIGQNFGAKKMDRVRTAMSDVLLFSFLWSVFIGVILVLCAPLVAESFSNDNNVRAVIIQYFTIIAFSFSFAFVSNGWSSAFNALGRPKNSLIILFTKTILILMPAAKIGYMMGGVLGAFWAIAIAHTITGIIVHVWSSRILKSL